MELRRLFFTVINPTGLYFSCGNDSCTHLPVFVTLCLSTSRYANQFHNKSNFTAMKQEIWFKHAYIMDVFLVLAYTLPISCVRKLITALFITVVFGNFSAFQLVQQADSREPSRITSPTVVPLTKIPHASHMTWAISHRVTLYWGCGTLKLQNIKLLCYVGF